MSRYCMQGLYIPNSSSMMMLAPTGEAAPVPYIHSHAMAGGTLRQVSKTQMEHPAAVLHSVTETHPRDLKIFAEHFRQRRIQLGVTQADVGKALANIKLPGASRLSQASICRFECLTISYTNMIKLKPILQAWLEKAEAETNDNWHDPDAPSVLPTGKKIRKHTTLGALDKRSLEAYFAVQPCPSGEKITAIAQELNLSKTVVSVWFCNQRQKQKQMKFYSGPGYDY